MRAKALRVLLVVALLGLLLACGKASFKAAEPEMTKAATLVADKMAEEQNVAGAPPAPAAAAVDGDNPAPNAENLATRGRKLIREGDVQLQVKDVEASRTKLEAMTAAAGGFVAGVKHSRVAGVQSLEITLRLPTGGFVAFVKSLAALGTVESENVTVTDVTDQWVDLNRRIETNEKLAARLEELIQNKSYQFKDLLDVERELARLRLDIERLQGTLRGLDDRIALSTLHLTLRQEIVQKIVPPDSVFAPLLNALENAGPNFQNSLRAMMRAAGGLVTLLMVLLPWLILALLFFGVLWLIVRRQKQKKGK